MNKNLGKIAALIFVVLCVIAIGKEFIHAFETLPDRIALFTAQFGR